MRNLRDFFNSVSGNNRIFTSEDIGTMSPEEFSSNEQAIRNQWGEIGIPSDIELSGSDDVVYVRAYTRGDGTEVRAHYRSKGGGRIGIGTVTGGASGMGNSIAPHQPTIEEMEKEKERMEKESLKILLERSSTSTENPEISQAISDITDIFNILGGFIPDGLMGNIGSFLSDYRENLSNILHKNGVVTGGVAQVNNNLQVGENKINQSADFSEFAKNNWFVRENMRQNKDYPQAAEMANLTIVHPENAPASSEYNYISPGFAKHLNIKYNLEGNKNIPDGSGFFAKDWPGIAYKKDSSIAKAVSNSLEMQNQIKAQYDVKTGQFSKDKLEVGFSIDPNLHRSLGHATILEPKIDKDGNFTGFLFDKYDFDLQYKDYSNKLNIFNDGFAMLQKTRVFQPYYTIIPVKFKW